MAVISRDLGPVTAYAAAVNRGYTGTRAEFEELMASYATVAQEAGESASAAADSASDAESSASAAATSASDASSFASAANTSAGNASNAATAAGIAQTAAESARDAAQSAQTAAEAAVDGFDDTVTAAISDVNAAGTNQKELAKRQAEKSEAWAVGKINGEDVGVSDPAYHNNAKYYAESVSASAQTASNAAQTATTKAGEAAQSASQAAESARTLMIDATLTQSGQAADSKAVGDTLKVNTSSIVGYNSFSWEESFAGAGFHIKEFGFTIPSGTVVEVSNLSDTTNISVIFRDSSNQAQEQVTINSNTTRAITLTLDATNIRSYVNGTEWNVSLKYGYNLQGQIDKSSSKIEENREGVTVLSSEDFKQGGWSDGQGISGGNTRLVSSNRAIPVKIGQKVDYVIGTNNQISIKICSDLTYKTALQQQGSWQTVDGTFDILQDGYLLVLVKNGSNTAIFPSDFVSTIKIYNVYPYVELKDINNRVNTLSDKMQGAVDDSIVRSSISVNPLRFKPFWSHTFIVNSTTTGTTIIIPNQSLAHINIAHRLGYNVIECNLLRTSDGHFICIHGTSGNFGSEVEHIDGTTDISSVAVRTVTLEWIQTNVRYRTAISKYRTCPPTAEEFLLECKKMDMIPVVTATAETVPIIDSIMGKDNYIAYANSRICSAPIFTTNYSAETINDIITYCDGIGAPLFYSVLNWNTFSDSDLQTLVKTLHSHGYYAVFPACYMNLQDALRVREFGFDFAPSDSFVNPFEHGNLCDISGDNDFSDFETTGSMSGGIIALTANQTIVLKNNLPSVFIGKALTIIGYKGSISVTLGTRTVSLSSDKYTYFWHSTYLLNRAPEFTIKATGNAEVTSIVFKASKV